MSFNPNGTLVLPTDAAIGTLPEPPLAARQVHTKQGDKPLFEARPKLSDIQQGAIGDCYLLASLGSILSTHHGADMILDMMKDNGDGTVTFRMYSAPRDPRFFKIKKTLVDKKGRFGGRSPGPRAAESPLWVQLIEKAYLMFARVPRTGMTGYQDLAGGAEADALVTLTGTARYNLGTSGARYNALMDLALDWRHDNHIVARINPAEKEVMRQRIFPTIFEPQGWTLEVANILFLEPFWQWNNGARKRDLQSQSIGGRYLTQQAFLEWMDKAPALDRTIYRSLAFFVQHWKVLAGPVGSTQYSDRQIDTYQKVARALAMQRTVTVATKQQTFGGADSDALGHSGGESRNAGLVGGHAYTVTDAKMEEGYIYFRLRNPWGRTGREYDPSQAPGVAPRESQSGDFWIEFNDFSRSISGDFTVGGQVISEARQAFHDDLAGQLQAQRNRLKRVN